MRFIAPKHFITNNILAFLNEVQDVFNMNDKMEPNVIFDLSRISKSNILGMLLMYKFIDYTYNNNCFKKPEVLVNSYVQNMMTEYGFMKLIESYISNKDKSLKEYKQLSINITDNFIIAPQPLLRNDTYSNEVLRNKFLPQIEEYYSFNHSIISMVFLCLSEILLNFWEHAVEDTKSILVAAGNNSNIEIACADTGSGIITTLGSAFSKDSLSKEQIILKSVEKGVTSKKMTDHMGYGLWILNEITKLTKGRFHIYSQGAYLQNNFGKQLHGKCGYWQGTIIYLSLPLHSPKSLSDIIELKNNSNLEKLKINFS